MDATDRWTTIAAGVNIEDLPIETMAQTRERSRYRKLLAAAIERAEAARIEAGQSPWYHTNARTR